MEKMHFHKAKIIHSLYEKSEFSYGYSKKAGYWLLIDLIDSRYMDSL